MNPRTPTGESEPDEPGARDDTDAVDPAQEPVRRLLADARHTGPVPADVAARLDGVLADLAAGREPGRGTADPGPGSGAPVVDLARRRRRRAVGLLVAAVAVVAVGLTTDALRGDGTSGEDASAGSASSARTDPADPADPPVAAAPSAPDTESDGEDQGGGSSSTDQARVRPKVVRADAFVRDVRRLRSEPGTRVRSAAQVVGEGTLGAGPGFVCGPPTSYGAGTLVPVRYRGGAAVLAYRVPDGRTQTVDLLQCGTAQVLRSTTLPRS